MGCPTRWALSHHVQPPRPIGIGHGIYFLSRPRPPSQGRQMLASPVALCVTTARLDYSSLHFALPVTMGPIGICTFHEVLLLFTKLTA